MVEDGFATVTFECHWQQEGQPLLLRKGFLVESGGRWLIDNISEPAAADPGPAMQGAFPDEGGWPILPAEMLDDVPLVRQVLFMPQEVYDYIESHTAPTTGYLQIGEEPGLMPPYRLDVIAGDRQAVEAIYPPAQLTEFLEINDHPGEYRLLVDGQTVQYIFPHPCRPDLWLVLVDLVSNDPRRLEPAQSLVGLVDQILDGLQFAPCP